MNSTTHLRTAIIGFLSGSLAAVLPALMPGLTALAAARCILTKRRRVTLCLALLLGYVNGMREAADAKAVPQLSTPMGALLTHERIVDGGYVLTLALDHGPQVEGFFTSPPRALGSHVRVSGTLEPYDDARNPGAPSPRALAAERGTDWQLVHGRIAHDDGVQPFDLRGWLPRARAVAQSVLDDDLTRRNGSIIAGLLWGDHDALDSGLHEAFAITGTIHVLTPAGLHIGIACAILLAVLKQSGRGRTVGALITLPLLALYAAFAGAHVPIRRAVAAGSIVLAARASGAQPQTTTAFLCVVTAICAVHPAALTTLAFWLSFCCVATIVAFHAPITRRLTFFPTKIRALLAVTLAAQLGTWPLIAYGMNTVGIYGVAANLIAVPLAIIAFVEGLMLFGVHALALLLRNTVAHAGNMQPPCLVPRLAACVEHAVAGGVNLIAGLLAHNVLFWASLPGARWAMSQPATPLVIVSYLALALAGCLLTRSDASQVVLRQHGIPGLRRGHGIALCLAIAELTPLAGSTAQILPGPLTVTMLDVGQGDGIVIRTPLRHTILIDTGGRLELHAGHAVSSPAERAGAAILLPYLDHEGIHAIDLLILTHPHGDHVGGAAPIIRSLPVHQIYDSGQTYLGRAFCDAIAEARAHHVPIHRAQRGDVYRTDDGVELDVLAPFARPIGDARNAVNEGSIIVRLTYQNERILFMGDAGMPTEARLLTAGDDLSAEVLKVGHHGSAGASSDAFLRAVHPRLALISVGRHNLFHHPARSTLAALQAIHTTVLRTDACAAIRLSFPTLAAQTLVPCART